MSDGGGDFEFGGGGDGGFDNEGGGGYDGEGAYTETTYESFGSRLKGSCAGICVGLILFFGSFPLLFWNEDRAVERYDALNEGEQQTISVSGMELNPANEGKLISFTADIVNGGDNIVDPVFGIETDGLVLRRYAEMYQWDERVSTKKTKTYGGKTKTTKTYSYDREWSSYLKNSNNFKRSGYDNPSYMRFEPEVYSADNIQIGAYQFPDELIGRISWSQPLSFSIEDIADESLRNEASIDGTTGGFYFGYNSQYSSSSSNPQIGDQRVWFSETPPSTITIVGIQDSGTLSAFVSETGEGGDILLFKQGNYTVQEMYDAAEAENAAATWILRFVGFAVMALGMYLILRPIEVFADIIPCVGSIIGCGIVFVAVLVAAILSAIIISIAWLVAHPKIGGIVLAVTLAFVGAVAFCVKKIVKKKDNAVYSGDGKVASGFQVHDELSSSSSDEENGFKVVQGAVVADEIPTVQGTVIDVTAEEKRLHDQIAQQ